MMDQLFHDLRHTVPGAVVLLAFAGLGFYGWCRYAAPRRWSFMAIFSGLFCQFFAADQLLRSDWPGLGVLVLLMALLGVLSSGVAVFGRKRQGRPILCSERPDPDDPTKVRLYSWILGRPL